VSGRVATPAFTTIAAIAAVVGVSLDLVWAQITSSEGEALPQGSARGSLGQLAS
jgi:hypothetical protein